MTLHHFLIVCAGGALGSLSYHVVSCLIRYVFRKMKDSPYQ